MTTRNIALDQIKAVACLLIACHHLAFYGPMADVVQSALPQLIHWLQEYGRMAVQVFLVLGGYFAAGRLAPTGASKPVALWSSLLKRYARLSLPLSAALICAIVINETVRDQGFTHASVSSTPAWSNVLAHLLLLHSIFGWESISAGVWYVSIDFQLYALCLLWLWLCSKQQWWSWLGPVGLVVLTALSLWVWNLHSELDVWALYFLGAYGLGMMAWWASHSHAYSTRMLWLALMTALGMAALQWMWRDRIAVALLCALAISMGSNLHIPQWLLRCHLPSLSWVGKRSYSIFLIHFPISLLVSAEVSQRYPHSVFVNAVGMVFSVLLSIAMGAVIYEWTERCAISWRRWCNWHLAAIGMGAVAIATERF